MTKQKWKRKTRQTNGKRWTKKATAPATEKNILFKWYLFLSEWNRFDVHYLSHFLLAVLLANREGEKPFPRNTGMTECERHVRPFARHSFVFLLVIGSFLARFNLNVCRAERDGFVLFSFSWYSSPCRSRLPFLSFIFFTLLNFRFCFFVSFISVFRFSFFLLGLSLSI